MPRITNLSLVLASVAEMSIELDLDWTGSGLWEILLILNWIWIMNCLTNLGSGPDLDWVYQKTCIILVIKKLYLVNFLDFVWTCILNFLNFLAPLSQSAPFAPVSPLCPQSVPPLSLSPSVPQFPFHSPRPQFPCPHPLNPWARICILSALMIRLSSCRLHFFRWFTTVR